MKNVYIKPGMELEEFKIEDIMDSQGEVTG